ncbi:NrfD/PsrC family molybdoenzyme membrane anchor subunit [Candidatus Thiodictyon syntrophicum]|jgi:molybdopterin-containing oxidoreductase family membrane subunit|uniref:Molybdopterin oxidoreductase n=1 Tax=Candidatus Thiodictyon syntrophicum TaxID=1166950 RepID=A0A2K8UCX0_9GAMM|nr:NrfD/PsrC family molybdoenzyme membrane anchor subunit [Candidatus Thiodictyon syntrophicum]AUB83442.1 molybdopterin oxidoreductase [Candidatus Thiodictyon syntrophicum]
MKRIVYREWRIPAARYWGILGILAAVVGLGGLAALYLEHGGHWVTGMSNSVVWGVPHVFAVFLILAASGAINVASIGTVFNKDAYLPMGRLSGLLAVALLIGGLLILVLDLGRPDRLLVAMTHYNFRSIFAWNIYLYTGFIVLVIAYLWSMADRMGAPFKHPVGVLAFVWRLLLTTATGSIFGFLVARQAFDTAFLAPMFVIMSFAYGLAIFLLVLMFSCAQDARPIGDLLLQRLKNLLGVFVAAVLYFTLVYYLTKLYGAKNYDLVGWVLLRGGIYSFTAWVGWVLLGTLVPLGIIWHPVLGRDRRWIVAACALVILGGFAALYVILIGSQVYPLQIFPGHTVVASGVVDGLRAGVARYHPSFPEVLLGLGGVAVALVITAVGVRVLQFLPESLADPEESAPVGPGALKRFSIDEAAAG